MLLWFLLLLRVAVTLRKVKRWCMLTLSFHNFHLLLSVTTCRYSSWTHNIKTLACSSIHAEIKLFLVCALYWWLQICLINQIIILFQWKFFFVIYKAVWIIKASWFTEVTVHIIHPVRENNEAFILHYLITTYRCFPLGYMLSQRTPRKKVLLDNGQCFFIIICQINFSYPFLKFIRRLRTDF